MLRFWKTQNRETPQKKVVTVPRLIQTIPERRVAITVTSVGGLLIIASVGLYHVSATPAVLVSILGALGVAASYGRQWWTSRAPAVGGGTD